MNLSRKVYIKLLRKTTLQPTAIPLRILRDSNGLRDLVIRARCPVITSAPSIWKIFSFILSDIFHT